MITQTIKPMLLLLLAGLAGWLPACLRAGAGGAGVVVSWCGGGGVVVNLRQTFSNHGFWTTPVFPQDRR